MAGEANLGTLRYLLTIPAGRTRLLVVKYAAIVIFALAATAAGRRWSGTIMGLALFGGGDMTLLSGTQTSLADGLWRLLLSSGSTWPCSSPRSARSGCSSPPSPSSRSARRSPWCWST